MKETAFSTSMPRGIDLKSYVIDRHFVSSLRVELSEACLHGTLTFPLFLWHGFSRAGTRAAPILVLAQLAERGHHFKTCGPQS